MASIRLTGSVLWIKQSMPFMISGREPERMTIGTFLLRALDFGREFKAAFAFEHVVREDETN